MTTAAATNTMRSTAASESESITAIHGSAAAAGPGSADLALTLDPVLLARTCAHEAAARVSNATARGGG